MVQNMETGLGPNGTIATSQKNGTSHGEYSMQAETRQTLQDLLRRADSQIP